jgi:hypothetical protein
MESNMQVDDRFGILTLKELIRKQDTCGVNRLFWRAKCDCGNFVERRKEYFKQHKDKFMSCGCTPKQDAKGSESFKWRGLGDISGAYFSNFRIRAKQKNLDFTITLEFLWELIQKQEFKCALSGLPISLAQSRRTGEIMTASIDRKKSTDGYVPENTQWVHKSINMMKGSLSDEEFIDFCRLIAKHNPS